MPPRLQTGEQYVEKKVKTAKSISSACPICLKEDRGVDGFDFIAILGLMKEYNWQAIWRRYLPEGGRPDSISMYVAADRYFLELHVQKMQRIILSEKFNTNPFFMQQVIQRITASHDHDLIMEKIRQQGIDTSDNPMSLSCSMGNIIIDLIANRNEPFPSKSTRSFGKTPIELLEKRPTDIYDLSSTLYLCQQNRSEGIFKRYLNPESVSTGDRLVNLLTRVGDYDVRLRFRCVPTDRPVSVPPPGNASVFTIHQVLQRMNFRHSLDLVLKEMTDVGLSVKPEQIETQFRLHRYINNTELELEFRRV
jgi:hypothetical protein